MGEQNVALQVRTQRGQTAMEGSAWRWSCLPEREDVCWLLSLTRPIRRAGWESGVGWGSEGAQRDTCLLHDFPIQDLQHVNFFQAPPAGRPVQLR